WAALRSPVAARRGLCSPKKDKQKTAWRSQAGAPQATRRLAPPVAGCPARFPAKGGPVLGATKGQQEGANPFFCLLILWARIEKKLAQTGATVHKRGAPRSQPKTGPRPATGLMNLKVDEK